MRHFSLWPLLDRAACGVEHGFKTTERDLVTCEPCKRVVITAELLSTSPLEHPRPA